MKRIKNAFKIGLWAYKNPQVLQAHNFKLLSDLMGLIFKVSTEHRHRMTHIAYIHPDEGKKEIVSIWAGAGITSDPTKRISELLEENEALKLHLSKIVNKTENPVT